MSDRLQVGESTTLLPFLSAQLTGWSRNKVKQRLQSGCVFVNDKGVKQHDHPLQKGDRVEIRTAPKGLQRGVEELEILYSDKDLVAINKPAGLLSVASPSERKKNALYILRAQLSRPKRPIKIWPVNRLDRETSGVQLFATSREMREATAALWPKAEKVYLAIVEGHPDPARGEIDQPLRQDPNTHTVRVGRHPEAKRALTRFRTLRTRRGRALLEVQLETGRQHQIRAHLAWLEHPVVGDARYGSGGRHMGLHALRLTITHPKSNQQLTFETPAPEEFKALLK